MDAQRFLDAQAGTIDDALASCMALYQPVPVWGRDGKMAGIVHPSQLAGALQAERT